MVNITEDLTTILIDLIAIKSESGEEKEICDVLEKTLSNISGELIREKNSLVFNMNFNKMERVALVGHIDTVPVAESSIKPVIKDGELWGRGACDMKSGLAVMLKIIDEITKGIIKPKYNLSFVFYENEEGSLPNGVNFLLDSGKLTNIDFAFILEPTEGKYSVGCLGSLAVKKEVFGVSAHSANPKKGVNALDEATTIYNSICMMNEQLGNSRKLDDLDYYETVNVTAFKTTNETFNVIPSKVEMIVNYRFSPVTETEVALTDLLDYYGEDDITVLDKADSCYIGNKGDKFLHDTIEREIMQAWTDIAQLNKAGIPAINFGAGSITKAHKPDERINIQELLDFYKVMVSHL